MTEIKLVFDEPVQRKKAPKHLADYAPEDRREIATGLGLPAFRANQIANHTLRIYLVTQVTGLIFQRRCTIKYANISYLK